jgi:phage-related protein
LTGDWAIVNRTDDGGSWRSSERVWLFQSLQAGGTVEPEILLEPPSDASGDYTVSGNAESNSAKTSDTTSFVIREQSIQTAVDQNNDGRIDDLEILSAIEWWRTDQTIPETNIQISNQQILDLAQIWREGGEY